MVDHRRDPHEPSAFPGSAATNRRVMSIGRVMAVLDRSGLANNTIVLFIADHGEYLGGHGLIKKMVWPYEELWRIPFIASVPGGPAGICRTPVSLLDLTPTFHAVIRWSASNPADGPDWAMSRTLEM